MSLQCFIILSVFLVFQETRVLAEIAKAELDGTILNNRPMRVRFATHGAALTVRNLLPVVTNELLEQVEWIRLLKSNRAQIQQQKNIRRSVK